MARVRRHPSSSPGSLPPEVADPLHPMWRDAPALQVHPVFGPHVDSRVLERLRMGGRVYHHVVSCWALANGFESERYPRTVDWRALRAVAGP